MEVNVVLLCTFGKLPSEEPWFFTGGKLYEGLGPYQTEHTLTFDMPLSDVRETFGEELGAGLPPETMCALWGGQDDGNAELVVAKLRLT